MSALPQLWAANATGGSQWVTSFTLTDDDGSLMNIAGKTFEFIVRASATDTSPIFAHGAFTIGSDYAFAEPWGSDASTRVLGAMLSVALAPFGLLGGWIFWRLAVRPAVTTLGDAAPVFD